jgi:hypothetical protein
MQSSMRWLVLVGLVGITACQTKKVVKDDDDDDDRPRHARKESSAEGTKAPAFKLAGSTFKKGDTIGATFDGTLRAPEGQKYWIALVDASQGDDVYGDWHYLKSGVSEDRLVADKLGDYEVRLYDLYPETKNKVLSRQRVSVVECRAATDCPGTGPACEQGKCVGAGSSPVPIEPAGPNDFAPDGWPVVMPPPGSSAPTTAEWNAVPREVTVKGSSTLRCETKVVREWLRVSCHANTVGVPVAVRHAPAFGQQAFTYVADTQVASVVVQMIQGKTYTADFTWESPDIGTRATYTLTATWVNGRPYASFNL